MEEIGRKLRAAREARGISMEQAEEETKIRRKYLEALERGILSDLPGEVYLKGFLRTYGNYLGLDGPGLVEEYKLGSTPRWSAATSPATASASTSARSLEPEESWAARARQLVDRERPRERPVGRPAGAAELAPSMNRPGTSTLRTRKNGTPRPQPRRSGSSGRGILIVLVALAVVGGLGYLGWKIIGQVPRGSAPASGAPASSDQQAGAVTPAQTTPAPPVAPAPEPVKVTMTKGEGDQVLFAVGAKEVTVRLEVTERVWVQAMAGDQLLYDGFPVAPQEFRGAKLRVRVGHMIGVTLYVNGQKIDTGLKQGPYTLVFSGQS